MAELGVDFVLFPVLATFLAGFMDSIAGGGLIAIPALLMAGSPVESLGTNKLRDLFGTGVVACKIGPLMGCRPFVGAQLGTDLAMRSGARIIKPLLVVVCPALAVRLLADRENPLHIMLAG